MECDADEICFEDHDGDVCPSSSAECVAAPEGCTKDVLCAPACAGLCGNYNCAILEGCGNGGYTCEYDCGSQAQCKIAGTSCKPISSGAKFEWSINHCVPTPNPGAKVGAACTLQGDGASLWDTCEPGAICWPIDKDTMKGTCKAQCGLFDSDPCDACVEIAETNSFIIAVCLSICDPLMSDCPAGDVCVPNPQVSEPFVCAPDVSGDKGAQFDPCESVNGCDPGLGCVAIAEAPMDCDPMVVGCCLPFCDTTMPNCPGGTTCQAWFMPGEAPPGLESLGVCGAP